MHPDMARLFFVAQARQAAEKVICFVIPRFARNDKRVECFFGKL